MARFGYNEANQILTLIAKVGDRLRGHDEAIAGLVEVNRTLVEVNKNLLKRIEALETFRKIGF